MATKVVDYYAILELDREADAARIKEAIKHQRRQWYKRQDAPTPEKRREAEDRIHAISAAEEILLDPSKREAYDLDLASAPEPAAEADQEAGRADQDWTARAAEHLRAGRIEAAHGAAREATGRNGADHAAWAVRGRASLLMNQADSAVFEFGEAIGLRPTVDEYRFDLGGAFEAKREYGRALEAYREAVRLAPGNRSYQISIASVYLQSDKPDEAIKVLEPLHAAKPADEICNVYLAMALSDATVNRWTRLEPGRYVISRQEQIALTKLNLHRAYALRFHDEEVRADILETLRLAKYAEGRQFRMPGSSAAGAMEGGGCLVAIGYLIAFSLLTSSLSVNPVVGILVVAAADYAWFKAAYQPRWRRTARDLQRPAVSRNR